MSCDGADFMDRPFDAGLKKITAAVAKTYEANYQALITVLTSDDPTAGGVLSPDLLKDMLLIRGYYLGKEQLMCLLNNEFTDFRGIQVQLGLTEHPIDGQSIGNLVYTIRGQFSTTGYAPDDIILANGSRIDGHFGQMSDVVYLAGVESVVQQPDPATYPNPPFVPPVTTSTD